MGKASNAVTSAQRQWPSDNAGGQSQTAAAIRNDGFPRVRATCLMQLSFFVAGLLIGGRFVMALVEQQQSLAAAYMLLAFVWTSGVGVVCALRGARAFVE